LSKRIPKLGRSATGGKKGGGEDRRAKTWGKQPDQMTQRLLWEKGDYGNKEAKDTARRGWPRKIGVVNINGQKFNRWRVKGSGGGNAQRGPEGFAKFTGTI